MKIQIERKTLSHNIYKNIFSFSLKKTLILLMFSLSLSWIVALSSNKSHICYSSVLNHLSPVVNLVKFSLCKIMASPLQECVVLLLCTVCLS